MFYNAASFNQDLCRWNLDFSTISNFCTNSNCGSGGSCSPTIAPTPPPTDKLICDMDDVLGQTFFLPGADNCWRVQLGPGGTLEADSSDKTCSKTEFLWTSTNGIYSLYDSFDQVNNTAVFSPGPKGFKGTFKFKQDKTVTKPSMDMSFDAPTKTFTVLATIPKCNLSC